MRRCIFPHVGQEFYPLRPADKSLASPVPRRQTAARPRSDARRVFGAALPARLRVAHAPPRARVLVALRVPRGVCVPPPRRRRRRRAVATSAHPRPLARVPPPSLARVRGGGPRVLRGRRPPSPRGSLRDAGSLREEARRSRRPRVGVLPRPFPRPRPAHSQGLPRRSRLRPARVGHRVRRPVPLRVGGGPRPRERLDARPRRRAARGGGDDLQAAVPVPGQEGWRGDGRRESPAHHRGALHAPREGREGPGVLLARRRAQPEPRARPEPRGVPGRFRSRRVQGVPRDGVGFFTNDGWVSVPRRRGQDGVRQGEDAGAPRGPGRAGPGPRGDGGAPRERPGGGARVEVPAAEPEDVRHEAVGEGAGSTGRGPCSWRGSRA